MLTTVELLTRGREEFDRRGMTKHRFLRDDGRVCAVGALNAVIDTLPSEEQPHRRLRFQSDRAQELLANAIPESVQQRHRVAMGGSTLTIMGYNDRKLTTKRAILRCYDRAIEWAKAAEAEGIATSRSRVSPEYAASDFYDKDLNATSAAWLSPPSKLVATFDPQPTMYEAPDPIDVQLAALPPAPIESPAPEVLIDA